MSLVSGENGILNKAENAVSQTEIAMAKETAELLFSEILLEYSSLEDEENTFQQYLYNSIKDGYIENGYYIQAEENYNVIVKKQNNEGQQLVVGVINNNGSVDWKKSVEVFQKTYKITYNSNGGNGTIPDSTHQYGVDKKLVANTFTKAGYKFKNWNTKEDGTGDSYEDEQIVKNLTENNGDTITLYAIWEKLEYEKNGMILYYDGIKNTRSGHDTTSSTWHNLVSQQNDATLYNCAMTDNSILFNGTNSYIKLPKGGFGDTDQATYEVVIKPENPAIIIADDTDVSNRGIGVLDNENIAVWIGDPVPVTSYGYIKNEDIFNRKNSYTAVFDNKTELENTVVYQNGQELQTEENKRGFSNKIDYPIVGRRVWNENTNTTQWYLKGEIYAIRIYNRKLTENEIINNYNLDKARFGIE